MRPRLHGRQVRRPHRPLHGQADAEPPEAHRPHRLYHDDGSWHRLGKASAYKSNEFDDRKKGMAISAAAGPISNILLATVSLIITKIIWYASYVLGAGWVMNTLYTIFSTMCSINISLAIFNLLPIPPFDGSRIFNYFLSDRFYFKIMEYEQYIFWGLFILLYLDVLDGPLAFFNGIIYTLINKATFFVDLLCKVLF